MNNAWIVFENHGSMYRLNTNTGETWRLEYEHWTKVTEK